MVAKVGRNHYFPPFIDIRSWRRQPRAAIFYGGANYVLAGCGRLYRRNFRPDAGCRRLPCCSLRAFRAPATFLAIPIRKLPVKRSPPLPMASCRWFALGKHWRKGKPGENEPGVNKTDPEALSSIDREHAGSLLVAYEPVWAIGTGIAATANDAQGSHHADS